MADPGRSPRAWPLNPCGAGTRRAGCGPAEPGQNRFLGSLSSRGRPERQGRESVLLRAEQLRQPAPPGIRTRPEGRLGRGRQGPRAVSGEVPPPSAGIAGRAARAGPRCRGSAAAHGLVRDDLVGPGQAAPAHGPVPHRPARGPARRPAPLPQPGPAPPAVAGAAHPRRSHRAHRMGGPRCSHRESGAQCHQYVRRTAGSQHRSWKP